MERLALVAPGGLGREVGMGLRFATIPVLGRAFTPFVIRHGLPFVVSTRRRDLRPPRAGGGRARRGDEPHPRHRPCLPAFGRGGDQPFAASTCR